MSHSLRPLALRPLAIASLVACITAPAHAGTYLEDLLAATPAGGWVKANLNTWSSVWPTGSVAVDPNLVHGATQNVVHAWSSIAWDSSRNTLMLWGGGHSSYGGNEMYLWNGNTGTWSLGSLPSKMVAVPQSGDSRSRLTVDLLAPQSAHTYEGNLYLKNNDLFVTLGGPTYNDAGSFMTVSNGQYVPTGPWYWDPTKASSTQVGGSTGSGWNTSTPGGNMWINQGVNWTGSGARHFVNNATAYRDENGVDVVYVAEKSEGAWARLFKFTPGDVKGGSTGSWSLVGATSYRAASLESSATIDAANNLFINTAYHPGTIANFDLNVWDLDTPGNRNFDTAVNLVWADGSPFQINNRFGIDYSSADGSVWMWDSLDGGKLYRTEAEFNPDGTVKSTWTVEQVLSTTAAQPDGDHRYTVGGKWQYVESLNAFVALDEYSAGDAGVWFYKPLTAPVPEPGTVAMLLAGLGVVAARARRRRAG